MGANRIGMGWTFRSGDLAKKWWFSLKGGPHLVYCAGRGAAKRAAVATLRQQLRDRRP